MGAEKLIRALREYCLPGLLRIFGLVLSLFKQFPGKWLFLLSRAEEKINTLRPPQFHSGELSLSLK